MAASSPKQAIAVQLDEVVEEELDEVARVRALGMAGELGALPGRQAGVGALAQPGQPLLELARSRRARAADRPRPAARRCDSRARAAAARTQARPAYSIADGARRRAAPRPSPRARGCASTLTAAGAHHDFLGAASSDVHEHRDGARDAPRRLRRSDAQPLGASPAAGTRTRQASTRSPPPLRARGAAGRQRLLEQAHLLGEHHPPLVAVVHPAAHEHGSRERRYGRRRPCNGSGKTVTSTVPVHVLERDEGHAVAALGRGLLEPDHVAEEAHARAVAAAASSADDVTPERLDDALEAGQRMAGDVEAEHLLLEGEALVVVPLRHDRGVGSPRARAGGAAGSRSKNEACPSARSRCCRWPALERARRAGPADGRASARASRRRRP